MREEGGGGREGNVGGEGRVKIGKGERGISCFLFPFPLTPVRRTGHTASFL